MTLAKQTVCLSMIVRNEVRIIRRCLESVINLIDHWVIVDTGSTDGTQQLIRKCLHNVPGELIERPWIDFAHNRNEALDFARGKSDYVFVIDADEVLIRESPITPAQLTHDAYYLKIRTGLVSFWRIHLFRDLPDLSYQSAVHEYLLLPETASFARLHGLWIDSLPDGARAAQPGVYDQDVAQLLRAHEEMPTDSRTIFYLAQSYAAAGKPESALECYQRCVEVSRWPEEAWLSLFQIAETKQMLQREWPEVLAAYLDAYQFRPHRAEPLYRIAVHYRWSGNFHLAQLFLQQAVTIPFPHDDYIYVEDRLYDYLIKMALATCCYHVGQFEAGLRYCDELLADAPLMPANIREQVLINRQQCLTKLAESYAKSEARLPKVKVFIAFRNAGPHFDNGIERLLQQTCVPFEVVFLDLGSTDGSRSKVPDDDARVALLSVTHEENLWSLIADNCDDDDVVLLLNGADWLVSEEALARLQKLFADPACELTYGQFQYAEGAAGLACPIGESNKATFLLDDWRCTYPLAFRGSLLRQVVRDDPAFASFADDPHAEGFSAETHVTLARKLFSATRSGSARFNAEPICVYESDRTNSSDSQHMPAGPAVSKSTLPPISCLTVTFNRLVLLKESIRCYCKQTYPNRELIVVTDGTPRYRQAIADYLDSLGRNDIRLIYVDEAGLPLGRLRNISLTAARGDLLCQWDDDDFNHPERLERQYNHLSAAKATACCFTDQLQFFFQDRSLYWSDWRNGSDEGLDHLIPGTLLTHRDTRFRYPETTPLASRGEDSVLLEQIASLGTVTPLEDAGYLNVYSYHGGNVFHELHHRRIAIHGSRSVTFFREREHILRDALRHYRLPEPYSVTTGNGLVIFVQKATEGEFSCVTI